MDPNGETKQQCTSRTDDPNIDHWQRFKAKFGDSCTDLTTIFSIQGFVSKCGAFFGSKMVTPRVKRTLPFKISPCGDI